MINGFKLHENSTAPAGSGEILDNVQKAWGFVPRAGRESCGARGLWHPLGNRGKDQLLSPGVQHRLFGHHLRERVYLLHGRPYQPLSKMAKVDDAAIAAVRDGKPIADAKLEALRQFAAKTTRQRGVVSEGDVAAFKAAGYDNRAVLDVLVLAATKLISNYTNHLAQTPNDPFMKGAEWTAPGKLKPAA
jgi:hypothetical protein